jgi:hypothetical protein
MSACRSLSVEELTWRIDEHAAHPAASCTTFFAT